ncbi:MAG: cupin domain-containing protein [Gemmatimonadetes bacterium]|nr:cupin domain-containing protein [Gemmatimonadota bacterium]
MRRTVRLVLPILGLLIPPVLGAQAGARHLFPVDSIPWREGPRGMATADIDGDTRGTGHYSFAMRLPDGAWIAPHFHPNTKNVIVLRGTLLMGHGDSVDVASATPLSTGGVAVVPAGTHHYEGARGETIILLTGTGPMQTTFVDARGRPLPRPAAQTETDRSLSTRAVHP